MLLPTLSGYLTGIVIILGSGFFNLEVAKNLWLAILIAPLCELIFRVSFNPILAKLVIIGTSLICYFIWLSSVSEPLYGVLSILRNQDTGVFAFGAFLVFLILLNDVLIMSKHSEKMLIFLVFYLFFYEGFQVLINGFSTSKVFVSMSVVYFGLFFVIGWSVIIDFGIMLWERPIK